MPYQLPKHDLEAPELSISVKELAHKNPYDFTQVHRHTYYELLLFEKGLGTQLIDFKTFELKDYSAYLVFPNQAHLLKRDTLSNGWIVQFREHAILSSSLKQDLRHVLLQNQSNLLFELDKLKYQELLTYIETIQSALAKQHAKNKEIALYLLQALLLEISSIKSLLQNNVDLDFNVFYQFEVLVDEHIEKQRNVQWYVNQLGTNEKKLSTLCKQYRQTSPLQYIHERLMMHIQRLLLFDKTSHKDLAFALGFDSPATFSHFVKQKTGYTPSELEKHLAEIHK